MRAPRPTNLLILLAVPAVPAALAPWCADWHWTIDLLACFPVQAMGWLTLLALLLAAARRFRPAAACAIAAAVAGSHVLPLWLAHPPTAAAGATPLRVMTINLLRDNDANAAAVLAAIRSEAPALVFCSEVTPAWWQALAAGLPELPHRCHQADAGWFGVALFSREPLLTAEVIPLAYAWAPAIRATLLIGDTPFGVLGIHPPRPGDRRRGEERDRALQAVPAALRPLPPAHFVLGDCNATPWNHAFVKLLESTGLQLATVGGWRATWTTSLPWPLGIPIDHILCSPDLGVAATRLGPDLGSDHLPVIADLLVPQHH
ncbi:MAG: endonuclease/exonuclease/phosphatase family protein [Planctomycetes bacterium]|nr:endonuclease/exonuclease/phosphatase family protein [Planctomycetota bacterium]